MYYYICDLEIFLVSKKLQKRFFKFQHVTALW